MNVVEPLRWDSEFFGLSIGRVTLDGATPARLDEIDAEARDLGIDCLYGTLDPTGDPTTATIAQAHGHRLVEIAITFSRPDAPFAPRSSGVRARHGTIDDLGQLDTAIDLLAPWSRFAADPRFGVDAARRMHHAWVDRAVRDPDRMLAVAEDDSGIIGVSTNVRVDVPRVDFMGVTKPGSGASHALMAELIDWAGGGTVEAGPCAARNRAVLRYVVHCGFNIDRTSYLYHRWLDEPLGSR